MVCRDRWASDVSEVCRDLEVKPEWFAQAVDALVDSIRAVCRCEHPNIRRFIAYHADPVEACNQLPPDRMAGYVAEALDAVADFKEDHGEWPPEDEVDRIVDRKLRRALDAFRGAVLPGPKRACVN